MRARSPQQVRLSRKGLDKYFVAFVESLRTRRPETQGTYQRALREFVRWFGIDGKVRFTPDDIRRYKRHLTSRKRLSPVSVSTYLTAVRRFCEYLVSRGILRMNPAREVGGNERPRVHTRDSLTDSEVERLLSGVRREDERGKRDFAMITLMLGCGLSEIELIRADFGDLRTLNGQTSLMVQGKGRLAKDEQVVLPSHVTVALTSYLALRKQIGAGDPLFASAGNRTRGSRMTTRGIRDRVNACLERAGIRGSPARRVSPYSLRHTAARLLARGGAPPDEIKKRMRLGSLATAMLYIEQSSHPQ